jgi:hypothetical protein
MRTIVLLFCTLLIAGCNKYPDGPAFSLRSKQNRLIGHWYASDAVVEYKPVDGTIQGQSENLTKYYAEDYIRWQFLKEDGGLIQKAYQGTGTISYQSNVCYFSEDSQSLIIENNDAMNRSNDTLEILRLSNKELWLKSVDRFVVYNDSLQGVNCDVILTVKWKSF